MTKCTPEEDIRIFGYTTVCKFADAMKNINIAYKNRDLNSLRLWSRDAMELEWILNEQSQKKEDI